MKYSDATETQGKESSSIHFTLTDNLTASQGLAQKLSAFNTSSELKEVQYEIKIA